LKACCEGLGREEKDLWALYDSRDLELGVAENRTMQYMECTTGLLESKANESTGTYRKKKHQQLVSIRL
jgi:hypothetical protein